MARCRSRYSVQVRCELPAGHAGDHGHSFYARYWSDPDPRDPTDWASGSPEVCGYCAGPIVANPDGSYSHDCAGDESWHGWWGLPAAHLPA
jgi:hypothetical protein